MRYSGCKEIDDLVRSLVRVGWIFRRGRKHGQIKSPDGKAIVTVPSTPSDWRSSMNFKGDLRRSGAQVLPPSTAPKMPQAIHDRAEFAGMVHRRALSD